METKGKERNGMEWNGMEWGREENLCCSLKAGNKMCVAIFSFLFFQWMIHIRFPGGLLFLRGREGPFPAVR